jgi:hypothetical protein
MTKNRHKRLRTITSASALLALLGTCAAASAQQRTFYDANGRFAGQSSTYNTGRSTSFSDARGQFAGSATRNSDGTTTYYDRNGRFAGSSSRRRAQQQFEDLTAKTPVRLLAGTTGPR